MSKYSFFSTTLIRWYRTHKRKLPWRTSRSAYQVWLAGVIFQQTRLNQGLPYYRRFLQRFPSIHTLAKAKQQQVLKLWEGLGYYSRARYLHETARYISKNKNGKFPSEYAELKKLKGVGDYTAALIASVTFHKPHAVLDGNVYRIVARYLGISIPINAPSAKRIFLQKVNALLDKKNPGVFNLAMIDFGALQCVPKNPDCPACPLRYHCNAFRNGLVDKLPRKIKKVNSKHRYFNYIVITNKKKILLRKRKTADIWRNLYDFPLIETTKPISSQQILKMPLIKKLFLPASVTLIAVTEPIKHILSHQIIYVRFWEIKGRLHLNYQQLGHESEFVKVDHKSLHQYSFPKPILEYLKQYSLL